MSPLLTAVFIWLVGLPATIVVLAFVVSMVGRRREPVRLAATIRPSCLGARRVAARQRRASGRRMGIPHTRG